MSQVHSIIHSNYFFLLIPTKSGRHPNAESLTVGGAKGELRRDMVGWGDLEASGWVNRFRIVVATRETPKLPGLIKIKIGEAFGPHRMMASLGGHDTGGWTPRLSFFAWGEAKPGLEMVAVGEAYGTHRAKFELGRHIGTFPEDRDWTERLVFWAPINVGQFLKTVETENSKP